MELAKIEVTVVINLKWHNLDYPSCLLVGRHLKWHNLDYPSCLLVGRHT